MFLLLSLLAGAAAANGSAAHCDVNCTMEFIIEVGAPSVAVPPAPLQFAQDDML